MTRAALIESWPHETILFVPSLPGFVVRAEGIDDVLATARERIDAYAEWLREADLLNENPSDMDVVVTEVRSAMQTAAPLFEIDATLPETDEIELALAVGRATLSDLLFVFDDIGPTKRAAGEHTLRHIAEMDRWYATRIAPTQGRPFAQIEDELVQSASLFEETIDGFSATDQATVWVLDGESWSIRKVLRRRTGHLREHLPGLLTLIG